MAIPSIPSSPPRADNTPPAPPRPHPAPVSPAPPAEVRASQPADRQKIEAAVEKTRDFVRSIGSDLQFQVDEATGTTVIRVVDRETSEVIRQIPSEEMLEIAQALDRVVGLLLRREA